ncbi:glycosyltransferase family 4 protein [Aurantimonas sp. A2-1-M11]|uniref:glycosyltransferase family 4 protein n=1 Tax=Aurantimonas sp. A2-1-M11 TaxID=3113712 RepID=UPI002F958EFE
MNIAFYAPMKSPDDPRPSGDRTVARGLVEALRLAGHSVCVPSRFRTHDRGDGGRQARLRAIGGRLAERLLRQGRAAPSLDLWFTYHLYHKAPDWLGPRVAGALGIPYVVAEASVAGKQRGGAWSLGYEASLDALGRADLVIGLNPADRAGVTPLIAGHGEYLALAPFLDTQPWRQAASRRHASRAALAERHGLSPDRPWLIAAAMMREDQKLASYRLLAQALASLGDCAFDLLIVGSGPAEPAVREAFAGLPAQVAFLGAAEPEGMPDLFAAADLAVWAAIKESWSMALLEAQAVGLPAVAGRSGGVATIVEDGVTGLLTPEADVAAFAAAVRQMLEPSLRASMGAAARDRAQRCHSLAAASATLDGALRDMLARHTRSKQAETA